jgi:hypothetical protein
MNFTGQYRTRSGEIVTVRTQDDVVYDTSHSGLTWWAATGNSRDSRDFDLMEQPRSRR